MTIRLSLSLQNSEALLTKLRNNDTRICSESKQTKLITQREAERNDLRVATDIPVPVPCKL